MSRTRSLGTRPRGAGLVRNFCGPRASDCADRTDSRSVSCGASLVATRSSESLSVFPVLSAETSDGDDRDARMRASAPAPAQLETSRLRSNIALQQSSKLLWARFARSIAFARCGTPALYAWSRRPYQFRAGAMYMTTIYLQGVRFH